MNAAKLHAVYCQLLAHYFSLRPEHEKQLRKIWGWDDAQIWFGSYVEFLYPDEPQAQAEWEEVYGFLSQTAVWPVKVKVCSMPSEISKLLSAHALSKSFDLAGVPGFYREELSAAPPADLDPSRRCYVSREVMHWLKERLSPWRINLNYRDGLLVPYDNASGLIVGIKVYRNIRDPRPAVLTSRGLPSGARAIAAR